MRKILVKFNRPKHFAQQVLVLGQVSSLKDAKIKIQAYKL